MSDRREWTPDKVRELLGFPLHGIQREFDACKRVADAHNAALKAERDNMDRFFIVARMEDKRQLLAAQQELAAEREKLKHFEQCCENALKGQKDLLQQLLAAQAAIKALKDGPQRLTEWAYKVMDAVDLSALEQHDNELGQRIWDQRTRELEHDKAVAVKPIVDALELAHEHINPMAPAKVEERILAALASVKGVTT